MKKENIPFQKWTKIKKQFRWVCDDGKRDFWVDKSGKPYLTTKSDNSNDIILYEPDPEEFWWAVQVDRNFFIYGFKWGAYRS